MPMKKFELTFTGKYITEAWCEEQIREEFENINECLSESINLEEPNEFYIVDGSLNIKEIED